MLTSYLLTDDYMKPYPPIIKKILQITFLLFSIQAFACDCDPLNITEKYTQSDFVANVTILKIYPNQENEQGYRADIKINELFKGKPLKSIYVYGRSDNGIGSSCDIHIPANTKLIAYARKNDSGKFGIGMCSGIMYLDYSAIYKKKTSKNKKELKRQIRELEILKIFKSKNIKFTDKINYREKAKLHQELKKFNGIELEKNFGIYEIIFESNLSIRNVIEISGFKNSIDQELIEIIKKTEWTSFDKGVKDTVPENSKLLIGIYYYPKEKGNPSFLSQYYL
ncbi:hypothetical protein [Kordia sp.]|uniref:hypothetical protein n=1 Tax=Kordia sp. TaxID=1965332 RepID=UPI0025BE5E97|nr:hypothetical protein [Kordia sp.]MCH2194454.1 hypothetical protein [Kordia sp.]